MRTVARGLGFWVAASLLAGPGLACGDKLLVVDGRRVRSQRAHGAIQRASILVYADPQGHLQAAIHDTSLGRDLELAGHTVRLASSRDEVNREIRAGNYDVLLADISQIIELDPELLNEPGSPFLLPVIVNATGEEWAEAAARYQCIRRSPSTDKHYLAVIEEVMTERREQAGEDE
jgi:hypothetical protein